MKTITTCTTIQQSTSCNTEYKRNYDTDIYIAVAVLGLVVVCLWFKFRGFR